MVIHAAKASMAHVNREARALSTGLGAKKGPRHMSIANTLDVLRIRTDQTTNSSWGDNITTARNSAISVAIGVLNSLTSIANEMVEVATEAADGGITQPQRNALGAAWHQLYAAWDNIVGSAINPDDSTALLNGAPGNAVIGLANVALPPVDIRQANAFHNAALAGSAPLNAAPVAANIQFSDQATSQTAANTARVALGHATSLLSAWKAADDNLTSYANAVSDISAAYQENIDNLTNTDVTQTAQDLAMLKSVGQLLASLPSWIANINNVRTNVSTSIVQN